MASNESERVEADNKSSGFSLRSGGGTRAPVANLYAPHSILPPTGDYSKLKDIYEAYKSITFQMVHELKIEEINLKRLLTEAQKDAQYLRSERKNLLEKISSLQERIKTLEGKEVDDDSNSSEGGAQPSAAKCATVAGLLLICPSIVVCLIVVMKSV